MPPKRKATDGSAHEPVNWASKTVTSLKSELLSRGIVFVGKKAELVACLEADDARKSSIPGKSDNPINWKTLTVAKLKDELGTRGLSLAGKKAELIARIESDDADLTGRLEADEVALAAQATATKKTDNDAKEQIPEVKQEVNQYSGQTIAQLKATLTVRGLPLNGKKPDLVARLEAHDKGVQDPDLAGPTAAEIMIHKSVNLETGERRAREFVPAPDQQFLAKLEKIRRERMFMLDRQISQDRQHYPCQVFDIAGSTGNIYKVTIGRSPNCDCMDARTRGQKCKHINYALIVILKAPLHLQYQLAFLSDELESMFANAPVTRAPDEHDHASSNEVNHNGTRKLIEGDCPICVFEMDPKEELVWCKASCGQNFHKVCFEQWRKSRHGHPVTCVYCRAKWEEAGSKKPIPGSLASLKETAPKIGSYRNIGNHPMYQDGETGK